MEYNNNDTIDNEKGGYLTAVHRNALRLQRLTKEILDVARIESNTLKLYKDRFDLVESINEVLYDIAHAQLINKTKNNTEIVFNKPDRELFITADRVRINEVITNLLSNAINTTKDNGKITISTRLVESAKNDTYNNNNNMNNNKTCVIVSIKDNGTGIDPEIESKIFTKFVTKSESGLGLGLYISRCIIEAHGGKIWGENNKDEEGATFAFSLYV
jgi:signal transduction histidine kinase